MGCILVGEVSYCQMEVLECLKLNLNDVESPEMEESADNDIKLNLSDFIPIKLETSY